MNIVDWIYPRRCVGCGREGAYICGECEGGMRGVLPICPECGNDNRAGWRHKECESAIDRLIVRWRYHGVVKRLIKKIKFESSWGMVEEIGRMWTGELATCRGENWVVSSVPMYVKKRKARGFNQAELLGRELAKYIGAEYLELLVRNRETVPMFGLKRKEREANVGGSFEVVLEEGCLPRKVMLVDDIWTTGSTIRECAKTLRSAGVEEIWGVALAR